MRFIHMALGAGLCAAMLLLSARCARIGRPEGGPRDSAPPVLLKTQPAYGAVYFKKKRVRLTFNEYVLLKDQSKQFLMSPPAAKLPTLMIRGKSVVVEFNAPLADSVTYLLDFGNSIVDNNEGNVFPRYHFAFATGGAVDTMRMTGLALDAATGEPLAGAYVCLYQTDNDSIVLKERPSHIARSDRWGFFVLQNIKPVPYKVVLLSDENKNYRYDAGQEAIGFFDGSVNPHDLYPPRQWLADTLPPDTGSQREPQFIVRAFTEEVQKQFLAGAQRRERKAFTLTFNAPFPAIDSIRAAGVDFSKMLRENSPKRDTLTYWLLDTARSLPDSLTLAFVYLKTDTLGNLAPVSERQKLFFNSKKEAEQKERAAPKKSGGIGGFLKSIVGADNADTAPRKPAHWTLKPALPAAVTPLQPPAVQFAAPLFALNPQNISVEEIRIHPKRKDTTFLPLRITLTRDSLRIRRYTIGAAWKDNTSYRYQILPNAFIDIYGQTNDTIAGVIAVQGAEQTATLAYRCRSVGGQYLIQLMDSKGGGVIRELALHSDTLLAMPYLAPASYRIKVIKDDNANGKWDAGSYFDRRQPEYAVFLKNTDGTPAFALKANWEQELSVDMQTLFPAQRVRSREMDFPFSDIIETQDTFAVFCGSEQPRLEGSAVQWLLFCSDPPAPLVHTVDEEWVTFGGGDTPEINAIPTEYIEFCNEEEDEENEENTEDGGHPDEDAYSEDSICLE